MAQTKFISLEVLTSHDQWLYNYISKEDAKSIKSIAIKDGELLAYTEAKPTSETTPAFRIEIPTQDLSSLIQKVQNATTGNLPSLTADGSLKDSGIAADTVAIKADVTKEIAAAIAAAGHMAKEVVTELPTAADAKVNTFYLLKIDSVTGKDKYEIYTKIGDELVMIDDTSIDLSGYAIKSETTDAISKAKQEAVETAEADATSKANQALADAKSYTDGKITPVTDRVSTLETNVEKVQEDISAMKNTLTTHGDKITALENKVNDMGVATTEEALDAFNSVFNSTTGA